ncbi:hypothetical protein NP493_735g01030 [Ridgeia piscesae]|uniref:Uncharacterized protein n=1 Tax=Ridgeia piscesae TaxID=27915 RepID=A0AAD9KPZ0_RIDPI|nr:hypothetical protein NP493_735g01030 [Ridgeia piscesae]
MLIIGRTLQKQPAIMTTVHQNNDGTISINYNPKERGIHELNLSYNEKAVDGMPLRCHVDKIGSAYVTAYGSGLYSGASGKEASFIVAAGGKKVDVDISGPGKVDVRRKEMQGANMYVDYVPLCPGEFEVALRVDGKNVHGSPFPVKISGDSRKRCQLLVPASSEVTLGGGLVDLANIVGIMKTPEGSTEHCLLKKMPDGQLGLAAFTPKTRGLYTIEVTRDGHPINGSPFKINVGDNQISNAAHVQLSGNCMKQGKANELNEIPIDISKAGYGPLSFVVEGAHRSDIECHDEGRGHYVMRYKPHEPGIYMLNIKFGDEHVTGSPFVINIGGKPSGRVRETVTKQIEAAGPTGPGVKCELQMKIPGTNPLDMEAMLTSPSCKSTLCEIVDMPDALYDIKFTPQEEGIHIVSLKNKGLHISGSPFQYTVGSPPSGGALKVEIGGPGLEQAEVGKPNEFNIYTREAGAGVLTVAIEGPSKASLEVTDRGSGYTTVAYSVDQPGEYGVHIKYDEQHVPDSPVIVQCIPASEDAKACTVHGLRDRGLEVGKPVTFNVQLNGVRGELRAHLDTPSGTVDDCFIQELDIDVYALRFIPKENGVHYVTVKLKEAHIPGSPYPMLIGKMGADPALVLAHGDGLVKGETGKPCSFTVVTTSSGSGTLNVSICGTSRVAIRCTEVDEGYEFTYTPMAPGEYVINIKYCNITIAACPKLAVITGKGKPSDANEVSSIVIETTEKKPGMKIAKKFHGDASKVTLKGLGLKKAFQNRAANFNVDVTGAGNALLMVGMMTASGNPIEELTVKKQRNTIYQVAYRSKEKGDHTMTIRWGTDDVPGSPLTIPIM